jgi:hypothetical protein
LIKQEVTALSAQGAHIPLVKQEATASPVKFGTKKHVIDLDDDEDPVLQDVLGLSRTSAGQGVNGKLDINVLSTAIVNSLVEAGIVKKKVCIVQHQTQV